jgi:hypothetical protein
MPPSAVKNVRDLIYWQYAKIISESAGAGKKQYAFVMNRFKKLQSGEIEWSGAIREYIREWSEPLKLDRFFDPDRMVPVGEIGGSVDGAKQAVPQRYVQASGGSGGSRGGVQPCSPGTAV